MQTVQTVRKFSSSATFSATLWFCTELGRDWIESVDLRRPARVRSACSPRGCQFSGKTSRNPQWRARACCLPCSQAGATGACSHVSASRTGGKIPGANRADFVQLGRMAPDVEEFLPPHIAAGKRKLHTGKHVAVGRNVAGGVTGAARDTVHDVFARRGWRSTEFFHVAHQFLIMEDLLEIRPRIRRAMMDVSPSIWGVIVGSRV